MARTALITGASSGIGAEFARIHAALGGDLVLVARRADRLEEVADSLRTRHHVNVLVIAKDLAVAGSAQEVFAETEAAGIAVDTLINNAGFGGHGKFHERPLARDEQMMQLNMATLTSLTHLYLQGMVERGDGQILNVASTAAFLPGPLQAVYYATKAFVVSFSQAIAEELRDTGVTVTALCPGPVDTGFVAEGGLEDVKVFEDAASAESVARFGYEAMRSGELVAVNEKSLGVALRLMPLVPRNLLLKMSRRMMEKSS